jgi:hypothetical protein
VLALSQFLLCIFLLSPAELAWSQVIKWVVQWLWLALSRGPKWADVLLPHLRTETDPVSETSCFLVSRIPDEGQSPKNPVIPNNWLGFTNDKHNDVLVSKQQRMKSTACIMEGSVVQESKPHTLLYVRVDSPVRVIGCSGPGLFLKSHPLLSSWVIKLTLIEWYTRRPGTNFPPWQPRFDPRSGHMDLCWKKWYWGRYSPRTSVSPGNLHFTECSLCIIRGKQIDSSVADTASELGLTPPHPTN